MLDITEEEKEFGFRASTDFFEEIKVEYNIIIRWLRQAPMAAFK